MSAFIEAGAEEAGVDAGIIDSGPCPPLTYAGSPCTSGTSCFKTCFTCLGKATSYDKRSPVTFTCTGGLYAGAAVTCWDGPYSDPSCTMKR